MVTEPGANFGASGVGGVLRSPVDDIVDQTKMDPRDVPELPEHLKKKLRLAYAFIQGAKLSGDGNKRREALKYYEDVKRSCDRWRCNKSFIYYAKTVMPDIYISGHHRVMGDMFERMRAGKVKRGMIFMPPGCSKSSFCSILFPAWLLGQRPSGRVLSASHTKDLVEDFGRAIKDLLQEPAYSRIYPGVELRADVKAAGHWKTKAGGQYKAVGVGSAVAGNRADLVAVIDDPISEQDAYSEAARKRVNKWYPQGFRTRTLPGCPILIVMTRWHHDDLAGVQLDLMETKKGAEKWEVIKFKAILDTEGARLLGGGAKAGDSIFPELWPIEEFLSLKAMMPSYVWTALYNQEPSEDEGNIILAHWWRMWSNKLAMPDFEYIISTWDTAYEKKERADPSACTVWGVFRDETRPASKDVFVNNEDRQKGPYSLMLLKRFNDRVMFPELREAAEDIHKRFRVDMNFVEPKASGKSLVQELRRKGLPFREWNPERGVRGQETGKYARAHAASVVPHAGSVYYRERSKENGGGTPRWVQEVIDQCAQFPNAAHDDLVDCTSMAWTYLRRSWWVDLPKEEEELDREWQNEREETTSNVDAAYG